MSEYQYYEFMAVDRPLTDRQLAEVRNVSSRAELTPTSFVNEYTFGDFKGDPRKLLSTCYDLMVYYANWGTHRFMFSVPREAIDPKQVVDYCTSDSAEVRASGERIILDLTSETDDGDWEEEGGANWMAALAPVRDLLIGGDLRPLYLAWLSGLPGANVTKNDLEPPVPPGLYKLSGPLECLADFLRVDEDLLEVAAQASPPLADKDDRFNDWLSAMPEAEKTRLLKNLASGADSHAAAKLRRRYLQEQASTRPPAGSSESTPRRPVSALLREAERVRQDREQRESRLAAEKRARDEARKAKERADYLDGLSGQEQSLWKKVEALANETKASSYELALTLLKDLRDLADRNAQRPPFDQRIADLSRRHEKKVAFVKRLSNAALLQH